MAGLSSVVNSLIDRSPPGHLTLLHFECSISRLDQYFYENGPCPRCWGQIQGGGILFNEDRQPLQCWDPFNRLKGPRPSYSCFGCISMTAMTVGIQNMWRLISRENPTRISSGTCNSHCLEVGFTMTFGGPPMSISALIFVIDLGRLELSDISEDRHSDARTC